jgi:hypothetical protein
MALNSRVVRKADMFAGTHLCEQLVRKPCYYQVRC